MGKNFFGSVQNYFREIDMPLFATVVAVSLFGLLNIYGIAGPESQFFQRHTVILAIGISAMILLSFFDYRYFKNHSLPALAIYLVAIFLLLLTFTSTSVRGTNAWIVLGNFTFEPSEFAKLALIILLSKYFSQRHIYIKSFYQVIVSGIYFFIPTALVLNQPDLGSAMILTAIWAGMIFAIGIDKRQAFLLLIIAIIVSFVAWTFVLKPYQQDRILSFINPQADPQGAGYNIIQSRIAIGSGYWLGNGLGQGSQAGLGFLPEPYHDFALAAAVEQFGFLGIFLMLAGILFILYRIIETGVRVNNNFGKLFCIGFSIFIFTHVFISAAVNTGLMPVTGLPLSLLSYGGSHMVSIMAGLGIVQSIKRFGQV